MLIKAICLLLGLTLGFAWGRQTGLREGRQNGLAYAPLQLRAAALLQGHCPVCDRALSAADSTATDQPPPN